MPHLQKTSLCHQKATTLDLGRGELQRGLAQ